MKRSYISPEFNYTRTFGTKNMQEKKSFMGSKLLEIEGEIILDSRDLIYYQNSRNEQLSLVNEQQNPPIIYSINSDKERLHTLSFDDRQTDFEILNNTKWILNIQLRKLLTNYIFTQLKTNRTFNGVRNERVSSGDVDKAIMEYINYNVLDRYEFKEIKLYLKYNSINDSGVLQSLPSNNIGEYLSSNQSIQFGSNNWNVNIRDTDLIETKLERNLSYREENLEIGFSQKKKRKEFNFDYYYDIIFRKK